MYLRAAHAETRLKPLIEAIQNNPLGLLTTAIGSTSFPLIQHTYIPWVLEPPENLDALELSGQADAAPVGGVKTPVQGLRGCRLRGHMARANPHSKQLIEASGSGNDCLSTEVTINFAPNGQHYITPKFYVHTKPETGKVVPTWNYVAVEVRGTARIFHDKTPETSQYLHTLLEDLTRQSEGSLGYDTTPKARLAVNGEAMSNKKGPAWEMRDAPEPYLEMKKKGIIGIQIEVDSIVGKWKMSQELASQDRRGVENGLKDLNTTMSTSVAAIVEAQSP